MLKNEISVLGESFFQREQIEIEKFSLSGSATEAFVASDFLKYELSEWATASIRLSQVNKWEEEYTQMLVDVMSGKVTIEEAEKSLPFFDTTASSLIIDEARINEWCADRAKYWQAGEWIKILESLRRRNSQL